VTGILGLRSLDGSACAKHWRADGSVEGYGHGVWWQPLEARGIVDLASLYAALQRLRGRRDMMLVRGTVREPGAARIRRAIHGDDAGLRDGDRAWMCCDLDTLDVPEDLRGAFAAPSGIETAGRWARALLPAWLRTAAMVAQWSASAGRDGFARAKLHLWVWLSRGVCCRSLELYARSVPILDPSVCRPVQPIYTADPIIEDGWTGPEQRLALIDGDVAEPPLEVMSLDQHLAFEQVEIAARQAEAARWAEAARYRSPLANANLAQRRLMKVIERHVDALANAGEGDRHACLVAGSRAIVSTAAELQLDPHAGLEQLRSVGYAKLPSSRHHEIAQVIAYTLRCP